MGTDGAAAAAAATGGSFLSLEPRDKQRTPFTLALPLWIGDETSATRGAGRRQSGLAGRGGAFAGDALIQREPVVGAVQVTLVSSALSRPGGCTVSLAEGGQGRVAIEDR
jgi:hypothetical protein